MLRHYAVVMMICCLIPVSCANAASDAVITINASQIIGDVPQYVFGHNVEAGDPYGIFSSAHNYHQSRTGDGLWDPDKALPVPEMVIVSKQVGMKMLRYPGGCLTHNFDWHNAVGPIAQRQNFAFGINEFITFCRSVGAEPLMNVSAYVGGPQDAADLVEYLNAPADEKHPWARKRAEWGHPQPYHIKYFEMGNESDHGNHNVVPHKQFTAEQYAQWFNECARRMRAIDPSVKMGALMGTGTPVYDPWNSIVLKSTKGRANFIIVHTYAVGCIQDDAETISSDSLMQACMAVGDQLETKLADYNRIIKKFSGKKLPLAITEYNAAFIQENPVPYRFAYGPALFSADYIRIMLKPETNVLMANYWHLVNGYWGMIRTLRENEDVPGMKKMPAYYLYRLWGEHFGDRLVYVKVKSPRVEFAKGVCGVESATGNKFEPEGVVTQNLIKNKVLKAVKGSGYCTQVNADGTLTAKLDGLVSEEYPTFITLNSPIKGQSYIISFEARARGDVAGARLGLGLCDSRGWNAVQSAVGVEGIQNARQWKKFEGRLQVRPDCPGVFVLWRLQSNASYPATGTIDVRNLKVVRYRSNEFAAYPAITASASKSSDGKRLYLIVFNKHHSKDIQADIAVHGLRSVKSVRRWTVTGPSLAATNLQSEEVRETESGVPMPPPQRGVLTHTFPARSMTAVEFTLK